MDIGEEGEELERGSRAMDVGEQSGQADRESRVMNVDEEREGAKCGKRRCCCEDIHLRLGDSWTDSDESDTNCSAVAPDAKCRKQLCPSLKKRKADPSNGRVDEEDRFSVFTEESVATLSDKTVSKNTAANTKWALTNFQSWIASRNKDLDESNQIPLEILWSTDPTLLSKWLAVYVAEARKVDGSRYPVKTLYSLLTGLLRHMRSLNATCPNFLDFSDGRFASLRNALADIFLELHAQGIAFEAKKTKVFSKEEEDQLWASGILGTDNPHSLLRSVFFLNSKNFCLSGGVAHRQLKISEIERVHSPPRYIYTVCASKRRSCGFAQLRVKNKVVQIEAAAEAGKRCHVYVLDCYLEKIPKEAINKDNFYLQPVTKWKDQGQPWFTSVPVGRNGLAKMVKGMCADAAIGGNTASHSLNATGATRAGQSVSCPAIILNICSNWTVTIQAGLPQEQQQGLCVQATDTSSSVTQ